MQEGADEKFVLSQEQSVFDFNPYITSMIIHYSLFTHTHEHIPRTMCSETQCLQQASRQIDSTTHVFFES